MISELVLMFRDNFWMTMWSVMILVTLFWTFLYVSISIVLSLWYYFKIDYSKKMVGLNQISVAQMQRVYESMLKPSSNSSDVNDWNKEA